MPQQHEQRCNCNNNSIDPASMPPHADAGITFKPGKPTYKNMYNSSQAATTKQHRHSPPPNSKSRPKPALPRGRCRERRFHSLRAGFRAYQLSQAAANTSCRSAYTPLDCCTRGAGAGFSICEVCKKRWQHPSADFQVGLRKV